MSMLFWCLQRRRTTRKEAYQRITDGSSSHDASVAGLKISRRPHEALCL